MPGPEQQRKLSGIKYMAAVAVVVKSERSRDYPKEAVTTSSSYMNWLIMLEVHFSKFVLGKDKQRRRPHAQRSPPGCEGLCGTSTEYGVNRSGIWNPTLSPDNPEAGASTCSLKS